MDGLQSDPGLCIEYLVIMESRYRNTSLTLLDQKTKLKTTKLV